MDREKSGQLRLPLIRTPVLVGEDSMLSFDGRPSTGRLGEDLVNKKEKNEQKLTQDDDSEYDTDIENEGAQGEEIADNGVAAYTTACELLRITPAQKIVDSLPTTEISLRYRSLGPKGAKALAAALMHNSTVEKLNLEENGLRGEGAAWLCDMLKENGFISHLNLSKNNIGSVGAYAIGDMLQMNSSILHLDLSKNQLQDRDANSLATGIEKNEDITYLNLSHNSFCEEGAAHLSRALGSNNSIETLDLSWNNIRQRGGVLLCNGLKKNYCITSLNLAWNGFGYDGAIALAELIRGNKYLRELDITCNRINWEGAIFIAKGLKENDTLESLQIGHNPLTMTGCLDLIEAVDSHHSVLSFLGLQGIPVNRKIVYMSEMVQKSRPFQLEHGGLLESEDILGRRMVLRCDPLKLLIQFLSDKDIRPVDLFRTFDKDNQHRVSREQFVQGLKKAKVPLDDYELERVLNRLDSAKEGKISYQRLMRGVKEQMKSNRVEQKRRIAEERKMMTSQQKMQNPDFAYLESQSKLIDQTYHDNPLEASSMASMDHRSSTSSMNSFFNQDGWSSRRQSHVGKNRVKIVEPFSPDIPESKKDLQLPTLKHPNKARSKTM